MKKAARRRLCLLLKLLYCLGGADFFALSAVYADVRVNDRKEVIYLNCSDRAVFNAQLTAYAAHGACLFNIPALVL